MQEAERVAREFVASWGDQDAAKTAGFVADGAAWEDMTGVGALPDREAMRQYVEGWNVAFPDLTARTVSAVADGDRVAAEVEFTGIHTGPMGMGPGRPPLEATGRRITGRGVFFGRVRDGKFVELRTYPDVGGVLRQLGVGGEG